MVFSNPFCIVFFIYCNFINEIYSLFFLWQKLNICSRIIYFKQNTYFRGKNAIYVNFNCIHSNPFDYLMSFFKITPFSRIGGGRVEELDLKLYFFLETEMRVCFWT